VFIRDYITGAWPTLRRLGLAKEEVPGPIEVCAALSDCLEKAEFVQESVPERMDMKRAVYREIEKEIGSEIVIATSASGLMISDLQEGMIRPERLVLAHPFNPPHLIPLLEIVGGRATVPEAVDWVIDFFERIGKKPIRLHREVPGHVANRLQAALWREAINLVVEGVASAEDVDKAISLGPGLRWAILGPHMTFHLGSGPGGMAMFAEKYAHSFHSWWADLGQPKLSPDVVRTLVEGISTAAHGRTYEQLCAHRDEMLVRLLQALSAPVWPACDDDNAGADR
jgi:3-hydroxybutyryl-CoA dehydrogenase